MIAQRSFPMLFVGCVRPTQHRHTMVRRCSIAPDPNRGAPRKGSRHDEKFRAVWNQARTDVFGDVRIANPFCRRPDINTAGHRRPAQASLPESWGEVSGKTVTVNGIDMYYEVYGEGEPVLLLHGGLGNGTYFANQIPALAKHHQLIVVDSRGHGRSTFDNEPFS